MVISGMAPSATQEAISLVENLREKNCLMTRLKIRKRVSKRKSIIPDHRFVWNIFVKFLAQTSFRMAASEYKTDHLLEKKFENYEIGY